MRPSKRASILEAANRVAERDGVTGVTLDSVAEEAGVTKSGVLYHFSNKDALLLGIQENIAAGWENIMVAEVGKSADEATAEEKAAAYARVAIEGASAADLAFLLEHTRRTDEESPWALTALRWTPSPEEAAADPRAFEMFIARLAADGLWSFEALRQGHLDPAFRLRIAERIASMIPPEESVEDAPRKRKWTRRLR